MPSVLLAVVLLTVAALGHVPTTIEHEAKSISSAMPISDPGKSWIIYGYLEPQSARYFSFDAEAGQRIYLSQTVSTNPKERGFFPGLALVGPGIRNSGQLPGYVTFPDLPKDYGIWAEAGSGQHNASYEPFGPGSYIEVAGIDTTAPQSGRYYVAAFSNQTPGHFALAVGYREEFSLAERITSPFRFISVYVWSGQNPVMILIPYLLAEIAGVLVFWRSSRRTLYSIAGTLAAFLFLATSASILSQIAFSLTRAPFGPEVYISLAIAVFHAALSVAALRLARGEAGILQRVLMGVIGTVALLAGSGLIMGAALAMAASLLPSRKALPCQPQADGAKRQ